MPVGHNVAFGIDNDSGAQRMLVNRTTALLSAKKLVEEIVKGILIVGLIGIPPAVLPVMRVLDRRFRIDVDHGRFQLLGNLRNWLESCCGDGIVRGVASDPFFSCPFTPFEIIVPISMPSAKVAKIVSVYAGRFAFRRAQKPLSSGSIELPPVVTVHSHYTFSATWGQPPPAVQPSEARQRRCLN
jgi:hypothetical protein